MHRKYIVRLDRIVTIEADTAMPRCRARLRGQPPACASAHRQFLQGAATWAG
ncbi:MAG: hypothetical protein WKG07_16170 [Hymenobacter sp.]